MAISVAITLQPGQSHEFDNINFQEQYWNTFEVQRESSLRRLDTVGGVIPGDSHILGNQGNINDRNILTEVESSQAPTNFATIGLMGKKVKQIDVSWRPNFAPVEYLLQGRDNLVGPWVDIPGTHRPNVSALGTRDGVDEFPVDCQYKFYRLQARMMPATGAVMKLVDITFYGETETTNAIYTLANLNHELEVYQGDLGTFVKNNSTRPIEVAIQHSR